MGYALAKQVHLPFSHRHAELAALLVRGMWMIADSPRLAARWVRVVPHVNDTVLLLAAIYLATFYGLQPWIVAKIVALVAYILIGTVALRRGPTKPVRVAAWIVAQAVFVYIVAVAVTKHPLPFGV
jgi:uncharacterized membrane protein SirB2